MTRDHPIGFRLMNRLDCLADTLDIAGVVRKGAVDLGKLKPPGRRHRQNPLSPSRKSSCTTTNSLFLQASSASCNTSADQQRLRILDDLIDRFASRQSCRSHRPSCYSVASGCSKTRRPSPARFAASPRSPPELRLKDRRQA